jgi:hypothetical protein
MRSFLCAALAVLALAGCQTAPKSTPGGESPSASGTSAAPAGAPHEIAVLTSQTKVWECPKCGMDFDAAGVCAMDNATLVETNVGYICPADNKPVEQAGKCPRCPMNARIDKVAVAANAGGQ